MGADGACLGTDTLVDVVDGRADPATMARVEAHASSCTACRELLSSLVRSDPRRAATLAERSRHARGDEVVAGTSIGRYVVTRTLGAGGMGVVYAARDPELSRAVAIKLLHVAGAAAEVKLVLQERLRREAQALAQLAHPNVVAVHDVGVFGDRIFVAMELVEGMTLAEWVGTKPRGLRELLPPFLAAARGLAAAHAARLVHRDFKPENVLVGNDGRVRVVDFGLARTHGAHDGGARPPPDAPVSPDGATTPADLTTSGAVMGTPYYMAPEQYRGETVDARTDQFSFCVALYTAVYGQRPFAGDSFETLAGAVGAGAIEKPPPGVRVPRRIAAAIRRGLAVRADERFPAMEALIAELEPPRRRWLSAAAVGGTAAVGIVAVLVATAGAARPCAPDRDAFAGVWDASRKSAVRTALEGTDAPYAASTYQTVERAIDAYTGSWIDMRAAACTATRIRRDQTEAVMQLRMACLDQRARDVRALVDRIARADRTAAERAVSAAVALPALDQCADVAALESPVPLPADPATRRRVETLRGELAEVRAAREAGDYDGAAARLAPIEATLAELDHAPLTAEVLELSGRIAADRGDLVTADRALERAANAADAGRHDAVRARALIGRLEVLGHQLQEHERAEPLAEALTAVLRRLDRPDELELARLVVAGAIAGDRGQLDVAERDLRAALALEIRLHGDGDPRQARILHALGGVLLAAGAGAGDAAIYFEQALALEQRVLGDDHPDVAHAVAAIAAAAYQRSDYPAAIAGYDRALAILERSVGTEDHRYAQLLGDLASVWEWNDGLDRAIELHRRALAIDREVLPAGHPQTLRAMHGLASALEATSQLDEAYALLGEALAGERARLPAVHPQTAATLHSMAVIELQRGEAAMALEHALASAAMSREALGADYRAFAELLTAGQALLALGRPREAVERLTEAVDSLGADDDPRFAAWIRSWLGRALVESRVDPARGRTLVAEAWSVIAGDPQMDYERASLVPWMKAHGMSRVLRATPR
jgi:serine/threonine protein kinase/tetratricopeptide (TPR) repeat protein